jgi:hypothetical protein
MSDTELIARVTKLETRATITETTMTTLATREDLQRELGAQTWRIIGFVCTFATALVAATYFVATHLR